MLQQLEAVHLIPADHGKQPAFPLGKIAGLGVLVYDTLVVEAFTTAPCRVPAMHRQDHRVGPQQGSTTRGHHRPNRDLPPGCAYDSGKRDAREILSQAFALAARLDAVDSNPVRDTSPATTSSNQARALDVNDVHELRRRVAAWQDRDLGDGRKRFGPERAHDLAAVIDVMIGPGTRIGECLALRWLDVAGLDGDGPVVVTVAGTLVELAGTGVFLQNHPKTKSGRRSVTIPAFSADALGRQRDRGIPSAEGLVFPSRLGTPRWPGNVRTSWRQVRGDDYAWVKPHSFRKTVGTMIERELGLSAASAQLGHSNSCSPASESIRELVRYRLFDASPIPVPRRTKTPSPIAAGEGVSFSEPPKRIELLTFSLRVKCSTD